MNDWFFHQERGKTLGPITLDEAKKRIRDGRIRLFDLVYKDGEAGWKMALEYPALRSEFKGGSVAELKERPWVCLQKRAEGVADFRTLGPFSTEEVHESLRAGQIAYTDYVWREGFSEWTRIGLVSEFNPGARAEGARPASSPPRSEPPREELLRNVVEFKRPKMPVPEPPPPEAQSEDLTASPPALPQDTPPPVTASKAKTAPVKERQEAAAPPPKRKKKRKAGIWTDWGVVVSLVAMLAAMGYAGFRYVQSKAPPDNSAPAAALEPTPIDAQTQKPKKEEPPTPAPEPKPQAAAKKSVPPSELYLAVQTLSSTQVRIEVRTDAGPEFPVYIQVIGLPGQVAEGASFYRFLQFTPKGNGLRPLDLSGIKLPQGRFILRAETGTLKKETRMSVGVADPQFKQVVARLRKQNAAAIWKERIALFAAFQDLERRLTKALAGQKFSAQGLAYLDEIKRTNKKNLIFFDQWWSLKDIVTEARATPSLGLLGRAKREREALAAFSVWK